jgi:hypothetical protein
MANSTNLNLPYLLAAQAQKHVTHNEALRALDALVQLSVVDRDLTTPPGSPVEGARYLVAASATGAWAGQSGKIAAFQDGAWSFLSPQTGWVAWVADEAAAIVFNGAGWVAFGGGGGGGGVTDHGALTGLVDDDHPQYHTNGRGDARYTPINPATLGINATANATNRLSVSSAASLFNHAGSGHQVKVNKNAATDTASFLFQTNFSGRAEIGTTGNDDFSFKVSPDGTTFFDAIIIDDTNGSVRMPNTDCDVQVYSTVGSFTWTKPVWAKANSVVEVMLQGGGGGGGSGRRGAASTVRCGGGGGAAGGYSKFSVRGQNLGATEPVIVGSGGTGGPAQLTNATNGNNGTAGASSTFATNYRAVGGNGGAGGSTSAGAGGTATITNSGPHHTQNAVGANASTTGAVGVASGVTVGHPSGGSSGGGVTSANAVSNGAAAGAAILAHMTTTAAGGIAGTAGGNGGGSGASSITAAAGSGGNGGAGAGGGGGGASLDGFNSGVGGNGGTGWAVIVTYR